MMVYIRADASDEIGTGHIMRCTTLAKQLEKEGATITFVCRSLPGNSISFLRGHGFNVQTLPLYEGQNHWQWTRNNWSLDAKETTLAIKNANKKIDLLIIDHYGLDEKWEANLYSEVNHIMVIDDLADRPHVCDLLLDQNYYLNMEKRYTGLVLDSCIQLLGPNYVLLRDEFLSIDPKKINRDGKVKNILVFFGGTDPTGETLKTIRAIQELKRSDIEFNIVVGAANPLKRKIEYMCSKHSNLIFHCQVSNMSELMLKADLSIGAGGSTSWERCFLQLPALTIIVAENQREVAYAVAHSGAAICIGESSHVTYHHIQEDVLKLLDNPSKLVQMASNAANLMNPQIVKEKETMKKIRSIIRTS